MDKKIKLQEACFNYGERDIFSNLNFEIDKADIMCLLGSNGCGKTTLLRCIRGLLKFKTGCCFLDGTNINSLQTTTLAKKIGFVFQDHSAPFPYPVIEVVKMGRAPHLKMFSLPTAQDTQIAEESLDIVGMSHLRDKKFTQISGGERQLVMIARTLAQGPDVILMDEPTSALDFKNQTLVLKMINKLAKQGKTIILSTHFPNHAMLYSSKVALMNKGSFIAFGPACEVITESNLKNTYGIDVKILSAYDPASDGIIRFCMAADESNDNMVLGLPGIENVFHGRVKQENGKSYIEMGNGEKIEVVTNKTGKVKAYIPSNTITVSTIPICSEDKNLFSGEIKDVIFDNGLVKLEIYTGLSFFILITSEAYQKMNIGVNSTVYLAFKKVAIQVYDAN
jgi:iron complex transport system ATP-binding protein